jgi:hypothetical protein
MDNKFKSLIGALLLSVVGTAAASTINVDFGPTNQALFSGTGASSDTGTTWNSLTSSGGTNLLNSLGSVTTIGVSTTASQEYSDSGTNELLIDRTFVSGTWDSFDVILSGLNDLSIYNLYVYGSNTNYASLYTVGAESGFALGSVIAPPYSEDNHYALLNLLNSTGGSMTLNVARYNSSGAAVISGFQLEEISAVPEPSVIALFGLGLVGLGLARRRRQV